MSSFSFLKYLDNYSYEALLEVENQAGFKNREEFAVYVGVSHDTVKSWFSKSEVRRKTPSIQNWNFLLFQLEAKRKGFSCLKDAITSL